MYEQAMQERDSLAWQLQQQQQRLQQQQRKPSPPTARCRPSQPIASSSPCPACGGPAGSRNSSNCSSTSDRNRNSSSSNSTDRVCTGSDRSDGKGFELSGRQAKRLVGLMQRGIASLHGACKGLEVACRGPKPKPTEVQQQVGHESYMALSVFAQVGHGYCAALSMCLFTAKTRELDPGGHGTLERQAGICVRGCTCNRGLRNGMLHYLLCRGSSRLAFLSSKHMHNTAGDRQV
eukprot:253079-Pelagomonas_calceolata.AAC.3